MVSAGKPWARGLPRSQSSLSPGGRGASRAVSGPDVPIEAVLAGQGPAGWGTGCGRPRVGCGGLQWAVALGLVFAPRPGGLSKRCLGLEVLGVGGSLQLVWNGRLPRVGVPGLRSRRCS